MRPGRVLRQAGACGAGECRLYRSGKDRRLHCARRLQGAAHRADGDDPERRGSPHHRKRPARTRRRRLSHRTEVGNSGQGCRRREICDLQRRRRRPRRVYGSQRDGRRSAPRDRGHGDCGLRDWREQRIHLCSRRVSYRRRAFEHSASRSAATQPAGHGNRQHAVQLRCGDSAGRRGFCLRRGNGAACLNRRQARHTQASAALPGGERPFWQAHAYQ